VGASISIEGPDREIEQVERDRALLGAFYCIALRYIMRGRIMAVRIEEILEAQLIKQIIHLFLSAKRSTSAVVLA